MAVTFFYYPIGRTGKYGIGLKAISGESLSLSQVRERFGEVDWASHSGALPVRSGRYMRKGTEQGARAKVKELNSLPDIEALSLVWHLNIVPMQKDFVVEKFRYVKLNRNIGGKSYASFSTQDIDHAHKVHTSYTDRGVESEIVTSVARSQVFTKAQSEFMAGIGERVIMKPAKKNEQAKEMRRPVKHKRTSSNKFWRNR